MGRLLLTPVATLLVSSVLFFGYVRLAVAYLPVLWVIQALALTRLGAMIGVTPRLAGRLELAALAGVVVLLAAEWRSVDRVRVLQIDGMADESGRFVEDQPMQIERVR